MSGQEYGPEFWNEIEAGVEDAKVRKGLRRLIDRNLRTGEPSVGEILDALQSREQLERSRSELDAILAQQGAEPADARRQWRSLVDWGMRQFSQASLDGKRVVFFKDQVFARVLYSRDESEGRGSVELEWVEHLKVATQALHPQIRSAGGDLDTTPIHQMVLAIEDVLKPKQVELTTSIEAIELVLREVESRERYEVAGVETQAARAQEESLRGHADCGWGRAMLGYLYRQPGRQAPTAEVTNAGIAAAESRDSTRQRTVEETQRILRASCRRCSGRPKCSEHLGLIDYPPKKSRGTLMLTDAGVAIVEAQKRGER